MRWCLKEWCVYCDSTQVNLLDESFSWSVSMALYDNLDDNTPKELSFPCTTCNKKTKHFASLTPEGCLRVDADEHVDEVCYLRPRPHVAGYYYYWHGRIDVECPCCGEDSVYAHTMNDRHGIEWLKQRLKRHKCKSCDAIIRILFIPTDCPDGCLEVWDLHSENGDLHFETHI